MDHCQHRRLTAFARGCANVSSLYILRPTPPSAAPLATSTQFGISLVPVNITALSFLLDVGLPRRPDSTILVLSFPTRHLTLCGLCYSWLGRVSVHGFTTGLPSIVLFLLSSCRLSIMLPDSEPLRAGRFGRTGAWSRCVDD